MGTRRGEERKGGGEEEGASRGVAELWLATGWAGGPSWQHSQQQQRGQRVRDGGGRAGGTPELAGTFAGEGGSGGCGAAEGGRLPTTRQPASLSAALSVSFSLPPILSLVRSAPPPGASPLSPPSRSRAERRLGGSEKKDTKDTPRSWAP